MNYAILADSACDLPLHIIEKYDLDIVSLIVNMEGEEFVDDMGRTFDKSVFFDRLKNGATASTSQVNTGTYYETFKKYIEEGKPLLSLGLSSELSGSYQSAVSALNMLKEEYDNPQIVLIDTKGASLGEGILVYEAAKMREAGKTLNETVEWLEQAKYKVHSWVTVDDIKHLQRGGRISATSAILGTMLNVKPIIVVNRIGKLVPSAKVRGRKKSIQYLVDKTIESITEPSERTIFIGHVGAEEEATAIKNELEKRLHPKAVFVTTFGPAIAAHTGYGSLAVFCIGKER